MTKSGYVDAIDEAWGFLEAVSWAKDLGLTNVIIEGDAKLVVDAIYMGTFDISIFGDYVRAIIQFKHSFDSIKFTFVKRGANLLRTS